MKEEQKDPEVPGGQVTTGWRTWGRSPSLLDHDDDYGHHSHARNIVDSSHAHRPLFFLFPFPSLRSPILFGLSCIILHAYLEKNKKAGTRGGRRNWPMLSVLSWWLAGQRRV